MIRPGVSSFCGAAAALCAEYTLPTVSQTVIITRMEGRTPVPEQRKAAIPRRPRGHYGHLPVHRSGWQRYRRLCWPAGPTRQIPRRRWSTRPPGRSRGWCGAPWVRWPRAPQAAGITKTALIVVGDFLGTRYRAQQALRPRLCHRVPSRHGAKAMSRAYLAFTEKGMALAHRLARALPGSVSRCGAGGVRLAEWTSTTRLHKRTP